MPLPPMTGAGHLPPAPGPHFATLDEVHERFVVHAPNRERREFIFRALQLWLELAASLFGEARVWIDGGFITHKVEAPDDVDVALLPDDRERAITALSSPDGLGLFTLQNLVCDIGTVSRLQPVGGVVDACLVSTDDGEDLQHFAWLYSQVKGVPRARKGFVEVVI